MRDDPAAPLSPPGPAAPAVPPARRRRWWAWALPLGLLALPLLLIWALWHASATLPQALGLVPGLQAQGVRGSAASGHIEIDRLDWALPAQAGTLRLQGLVLQGLRWHWGGTPRLHIDRLTIRSLGFQSAPAAAPRAPAPSTLRMPLTLTIDTLQIDTLQIDTLPPMRRLATRLALGAEGGWQHRIDGLTVDWEQARLRADARLGGQAGLPLAAQVQAQSIGHRPWQARAEASGPLAGFVLQATAQGNSVAGQPAPALQAQARVEPFASWPLSDLSLTTRQLDLAAVSTRWPRTALTGRATLKLIGLDRPAQASVALHNEQPGRWDQGQLPLARLMLELAAEPRRLDRMQLPRFELQLADGQASAGSITGSGQWERDTLALSLQLDAVQPARLDARAAPMRLSGPLTLQAKGLPIPGGAPNSAGPSVAVQARLTGQTLDGVGEPVRITLSGEGNAQRWQLREAQASAGRASALASGDAQREPDGWRLALSARLSQFDPLPWWRGDAGSPWRRGGHRLSGEAQLQGLWRGLPPAALQQADPWARWRRAATGALRASLVDSQLAGVPLAGQLSLANDASTLRWSLGLLAAGNRLALAGSQAADGRLSDARLQLDAPALAPLGPLFQWLAHAQPATAGWLPAAGQLQLQARLDGRWPALESTGTLQLRGLRSPQLQLAQAEAQWRRQEGGATPMTGTLALRGLVLAGQPLDRLEARAEGSLADHSLHLVADSPWRLPAWTEHLLGPAGSGTRLEADGRGQWQRVDGGHRWRVSALGLRGGARDARDDSRAWLAASGLAGELALDERWAPVSLQLAPGRVQLLGTALRWQQAQWRATGTAPAGAQLDAELETIDVAALLHRLQPTMGWRGDLNIGGRIQVRSGERFDADVVLERLGGDLAVVDDLGNRQPLGLSELRLALSVHDGLWQFAQGLAGQHLGEIAGAQVVRTTPERRWPAPDAPLQGVLEARVAKLGVWGAWVPPGWQLSGRLNTSATLGGRFSAPELSGRMQGSGLGARSLLQGIGVSDGELLITLAGERAQVERFEFRGGEGRLTLSGGALLGAQPSAQLQLTADHFRLLGRIDRRLVASGQAALKLDARQLQLDGRIRVDDGLFDLSRADAPALDTDVQVYRGGLPSDAGAKPAAPPLPAPLRNARVDVQIELGDRLKLRGRGIDTGLRGSLRISSPGGRLALNGSVRTEGGTYAAYGQKLEIERGELVFTGTPDNPRLDVLAIRPNLDVKVGVSVVGGAQSPRIRLVSEPEMAEFDKLSWLVLGRSPDGLGRTDTALLQRAAVALLAGSEGRAPTDTLVETLGLTDFSLRQTEGDVRETIVSLGKQLSRRWYVGYERSVNATTGTWQLIYRVAQRLTVRAQSGAETAVDVIWSWRW
ncbi:MAG: translocation/assembly module TamB domain-containing protein [Burkholderiales bacterium]|nr:translocation/assembly module TamB domain-containing protein [Burkholderiales bacterium]